MQPRKLCYCMMGGQGYRKAFLQPWPVYHLELQFLHSFAACKQLMVQNVVQKGEYVVGSSRLVYDSTLVHFGTHPAHWFPILNLDVITKVLRLCLRLPMRPERWHSWSSCNLVAPQRMLGRRNLIPASLGNEPKAPLSSWIIYCIWINFPNSYKNPEGVDNQEVNKHCYNRLLD